MLGVCLCVGSGESINIRMHRSNVSAAFSSGGRPVFWAGGQAAVCTSTETVCVFLEAAGQQVLQRREHKNTRASDRSAYTPPQPSTAGFYLCKH